MEIKADVVPKDCYDHARSGAWWTGLGLGVLLGVGGMFAFDHAKRPEYGPMVIPPSSVPTPAPAPIIPEAGRVSQSGQPGGPAPPLAP